MWNDNVIAGNPVDGTSDPVFVGDLKSINDAEDFGGITFSGGGVGHNQTDLLGWIDYEDRADGQNHALGVDVGSVLIVNHVVQVGDLAVRIGNNGELEAGASDLINVLDPAVVGLDIVGAKTDELKPASSELGLELSKSAELSGAEGSKVIGVGERG